jgi:hypothetical protein
MKKNMHGVSFSLLYMRQILRRIGKKLLKNILSRVDTPRQLSDLDKTEARKAEDFCQLRKSPEIHIGSPGQFPHKNVWNYLFFAFVL